MDNPPLLPTNISSNGEELWRWADKASQWIQVQSRIQELKYAIRQCGTRCGDCDKWMKSSECPREKNVNGMTRGPSINAPICNQFVIKNWVIKHQEDLQKELTHIETTGSLAV